MRTPSATESTRSTDDGTHAIVCARGCCNAAPLRRSSSPRCEFRGGWMTGRKGWMKSFDFCFLGILSRFKKQKRSNLVARDYPRVESVLNYKIPPLPKIQIYRFQPFSTKVAILEFFDRSKRCVFNCTFRDFVPIHICHLSQPALSTRYCHFAPTWNRPVPRPPRLKIT